MDHVDAVVIGAGVVGLAIARVLALRGHEVLIVERENHIGAHTSSRNSEVIHAGIYYEKGSLKAQTCVAGARRLYAFCESHGVPHRRVGKLIVATSDDQIPVLEALRHKAHDNGAHNVCWAQKENLRKKAPSLRFQEALKSPDTGILDSHQYMLALLGDAQDCGAALALKTECMSARQCGQGIRLQFGDGLNFELSARIVINAAGLRAPALAAKLAQGLCDDRISPQPEPRFAKGSYFSLNAASPFSQLIYPAPEPGGLGVHLTLDMAGRARFGPDLEWVSAPDYNVDAARSAHFYAAIRRYWPGLPDGALSPAYAGVRPKIWPDNGEDFRIDACDVGESGRFISLFGIESPGLTASLDLADRIADLCV